MVYVGQIQSMEELPEAGLERKPDIYGKPYRVVFAVSEAIRGEKVKQVEFRLALQSTLYLDYMREHKFEILLSAGPTHMESFPRPERSWDGETYYHFRVLSKLPQKKVDDPILSQLAIYYDHGRIFTADLGIMSDRNKILRRVREFAKKHPEPLPVTHLHVPNPFGALVGSPNAFCAIVLPKSEETKTMLLDLVAHPEKMIRRMKVKDAESFRQTIVENAKRALESLSQPGNIGG